jgi:hypothetical protein
MFRKPWVAYYSGLTDVYLPPLTVKDLVPYAREKRITHLVIDTRFVGTLRPELISLTDPSCAPKGVVHIRGFIDSSSGIRAELYGFTAEQERSLPVHSQPH